MQRSLFGIYVASWFEVFDSSKIGNLGYKPSCSQLWRKSMPIFSLSCFNFTFTYFLELSWKIMNYYISIFMYFIILCVYNFFLFHKSYSNLEKHNVFQTTYFNHIVIFFKLADYYKINNMDINHRNCLCHMLRAKCL